MPVEETAVAAESASSSESEQTGDTGGDATVETTETEAEAAPPEQVKPPEVKKDPMGPRFAALTKREKALVERDQALKAQETAHAAKVADLAHLERAKKAVEAGDYDAVLEHLGAMKDDDALRKFMTGVNGVVLRKKDLPPELISTMRQLKELNDERAADKKAQEDADQKRKDDAAAQQTQLATAARQEFLDGPVAAHIKEHAEQLEVLHYSINKPDSRQQVLDAVFAKVAEEKQKVEDSGRAFSLSDDLPKALAKAAEEVEGKLTKLFGDEITGLGALKKLQPKKTEAATPQAPTERRAAAEKQLLEGQPASQRPKTLTNSVLSAPTRDESSSTNPEVLFQRALKML